MKNPSLFAALVLLVASIAWADPVRVACVGDSITHGSGAPAGWSYPDQLQRLLGSGYAVRNFGVSGATLMKQGNLPYGKTPLFQQALAYKADVVVLMLGTNDTKAVNWGKHAAEFEPDYRWLVGQLQATNPTQKLYLCRPTWIAGKNGMGIDENVLKLEIPIIDSIAASVNAQEIDMHAALLDHREVLPDTVHPNQIGAGMMAKAAYKAITGKDWQGDVPPPAAPTAAHAH